MDILELLRSRIQLQIPDITNQELKLRMEYAHELLRHIRGF